jgi:hypothetical protein
LFLMMANWSLAYFEVLTLATLATFSQSVCMASVRKDTLKNSKIPDGDHTSVFMTSIVALSRTI